MRLFSTIPASAKLVAGRHQNNMCVYVLMYVCMYVCMYAYIYIYIYIYIYPQTHTHTDTHVTFELSWLPMHILAAVIQRFSIIYLFQLYTICLNSFFGIISNILLYFTLVVIYSHLNLSSFCVLNLGTRINSVYLFILSYLLNLVVSDVRK